jgi:hypothetical protein
VPLNAVHAASARDRILFRLGTVRQILPMIRCGGSLLAAR